MYISTLRFNGEDYAVLDNGENRVTYQVRTGDSHTVIGYAVPCFMDCTTELQAWHDVNDGKNPIFDRRDVQNPEEGEAMDLWHLANIETLIEMHSVYIENAA